MSLVEATPELIRSRIDGIPSGIIEVPDPSPKFPNGVLRVDGDTLRTLDMLLVVSGARISEAAANPSGARRNVSASLSLEEDTLDDEPVLLIKRTPLKKKSAPTLEIGVPLNPEYEPFSRPVLDAWRRVRGNPCNLTASQALAANHLIFTGIGYRIRPRVIYERSENGKPIRDAAGRKVIKRVVAEHMKPAANHVIRHIRATELRRRFKLTREERTAFFNWSTMNLGGSAMQDDYDQVEWIEWFSKLCKRRT